MGGAAMSDGLPAQDELDTATVLWNLADLYAGPDDGRLADDVAWCRTEAPALRRDFSNKVADLDAPALALLVARLETLDCTLAKLGAYAFLLFATQLDNAAASALDQGMHELGASCAAETVFFALEFSRLDEERAQGLLEHPALAGYRHYLQQLRLYSPHLLSLAEERLLAEREAVGRNSWTSLFDKVLGHTTFGPRQRSEEEVLADLHHPQRRVRRQAARDMTAGLRGQSHILTHIYNTLAAEKMITDRQRRHRSWLEAMNLDNQLREETVATLVGAVTSRYDLVERYYRVKRRLLGLKRLEHYDRYAPLPSLPTAKISWQECRRIVLDAFAPFSKEMAEVADGFFMKGWIHAPLLPHKRGGAFAHPTVPDVHPYLMVNYTGNVNDVSTVAHELGHGIHQVLAARQGHYNSETPTPLAETASVFAELLVFERQLALLGDAGERRALICHKIESIFATVFRQTAMNEFEGMMHQGRRDKGELSCEELSGYWLASQRRMFGDAVHLDDDYGLWWSYIPHFLESPGYVYSYAFGELLVLALYRLYQAEGRPFVARYLDLLAAGGSRSPYELLQVFGIDLDDERFWRGGLAVIEEMVARVE
jgi:oligoendopeptidase F